MGIFGRSDRMGSLVTQDADALMAQYGASAYDEARTRARQERLGQIIEGNRPAGHWDRVRREIAFRTERHGWVDTATRYTTS